jgi:SNF family Na+-dependent transporter
MGEFHRRSVAVDGLASVVPRRGGIHSLRFAFAPHWDALSGGVLLAAIGQAFYATGVGQAMMIAYGCYMSRQAPLVRPALLVSGSILFVSRR